MDDVIVLKVPQSVKGRWVGITRKSGEKLVPWIIERVENTLPVKLSGAKPTTEYGQPDEKHATITIECSKDIKTHWQQLARDEGLRLTDWVVNRVEFVIAAEQIEPQPMRAPGRPAFMEDSKVRRAHLDNARFEKAVQVGDGNFSEGLRRMIDIYKIKD